MKFENLGKLIKVEKVSKISKQSKKTLEKFVKEVDSEKLGLEYDIFFINYFNSRVLLKFQNFFRIYKDLIPAETIKKVEYVEDTYFVEMINEKGDRVDDKFINTKILCNKKTLELYPTLNDLGVIIVNDLQDKDLIFLNKNDFTFIFKDFKEKEKENDFIGIDLEFDFKAYPGYLKSSFMKLR